MMNRIKVNIRKLYLICYFLIWIFAFILIGSNQVFAATSVEEFEEQLSLLESVVDVRKVPIANPESLGDNCDIKTVFIVNFEQPIDWNDKSLGSFNQRVTIAYNDADKNNLYNIGGYCLNDYYYPPEKSDYILGYIFPQELQLAYSANSISIEYRYFGSSKPDGYSSEDPQLLEYLTVENAAKDFHHIISELSKILPEKAIITGISKGGYTTNVQAMMYPDDAAVFLPVCSPLCIGDRDERLEEYVYTSIGDEVYGKEKAAELRKIMLDFTLELYKYKPQIIEGLRESYVKAGISPIIINGAEYGEETFFSLGVDDFIFSIWQYYDENKIEYLKSVMANDDEEEKIESYVNILNEADIYGSFSKSDATFSYYYQTYIDMGSYCYDFSYVRNAIAEKKANDPGYFSEDVRVDLPQDVDKDVLKMFLFGEDNYNRINFNSDFNERVKTFSDSTSATIISIDAKNDPWYAVRMPDADNPNVHRYYSNSNHNSSISSLTKDEQNEIYSIINEALEKEGDFTVSESTVTSPKRIKKISENRIIDLDTYKSDVPAGTFTLYLDDFGESSTDMKAHFIDQIAISNQLLLAKANAKALGIEEIDVIGNWGIYPRRELSLSENGSKHKIVYKLKEEIAKGTIVYAQCYSPEDGAYLIKGIATNDGFVEFDDYILRNVVNFTIFAGK